MNALKFPFAGEAPGDPEPPEVRAFSRNLAEDLVRELLHQVALRLATPPAPAESAALQAKALAAAGPGDDETVKSYRKRRNAHRFWSHVKKGEAGECWLWTAAPKAGGYGVFFADKRRVRAHRWSYEDAFGPIPRGLIVLHSCDVPACVNPAHLRAGTNAENAADKVSRRRHRYGERHPNARLTFAQVELIRASAETQAVLASRFGVSRHTIKGIRDGARWKLTDAPPGPQPAEGSESENGRSDR